MTRLSEQPSCSEATPGNTGLQLDREALADLIHEGIEEAQRRRGARAQTLWFDAAEAADLVLYHVTKLTEAGDKSVGLSGVPPQRAAEPPR